MSSISLRIWGILLFILISCTTLTKEVVKGYSLEKYSKVEKKIVWKTPETVRSFLGKPAMEGVCKSCAKGGTYRMIYPVKDMQKFYLEITYNTDVELECTVIDFYPIKRKKTVSYVFPRKGKLKKLLRCNQKDGVILKLQEEIDSQT